MRRGSESLTERRISKHSKFIKAVLMSWLPSNNRAWREILTCNNSPPSPSYRCASQVLEQWESQQGQSSPAQTSLSAPVIPYSAPFPTHHLHRASVPDSASEALALAKPDPYDLYEKSRAIFESRRKYQSSKMVPGDSPAP